MNSLIRSLLIAPIALWVAAPAMADLAPSAPRPAVQVQMADASTPAADHDAYVQKARDELQVWRAKLDQFAASAKGETKETRKTAEENLNGAWLKAKVASAKLETAGAADWASAKASFKTASDELAAAWAAWTKVGGDAK